jgi:hypothetical protein
MGIEMLSWMANHERYRETADAVKEAFSDSPNIEDMITELDEIIKSLEGSDSLEERVQRSVAGNLRTQRHPSHSRGLV